MYRDETWEKGYYVDNMQKRLCFCCGKQFIIGEELTKDCYTGYPVCPYCGSKNTELTVTTTDDQLEELASDLGCLAIYVQK